MSKSTSRPNPVVLLALGIFCGVAIATLWPSQSAHAVTTDRASKFALASAELSVLGAAEEAVWVLDFPTGALTGSVLNSRTGKFSHRYFRNVAADFNVDPTNRDPQYAIISARGNLPSARGTNPASGVIYVAELTSGKVIAYAFPYTASNRPIPAPIPLVPQDTFQFREAVPQN